MRAFFRSFDGVRDVSYDLQPGKPDYLVTLKPSAAAVLGVTARDIATELRAAFQGDTGLEVRDELGALDIVARLSGADRATRADLEDIRVPGPEGASIPLTAVADIGESRGYASIQRIDGWRTVSIQGAINPDIGQPVEQKGGVPDQGSQPGADIVTGCAEFRVGCQKAGRLVKLIENPVGGARIVLGNVLPDLDQVFAGLTAEQNTGHSGSGLTAAAARLGLDVVHGGVVVAEAAGDALVPHPPQQAARFPLPQAFPDDLAGRRVIAAGDRIAQQVRVLVRHRNADLLAHGSLQFLRWEKVAPPAQF